MHDAIVDMLRSDGSITVNKRLIRELGTLEALLYSELLSRYRYFADQDRLTTDGYFYNTIEDLQEGTGMTRRQQDAIIKNLVEAGVLDVSVRGIPAKRHFRISSKHTKRLMELFLNDKPKKKTSADLVIETFQRAGAVKDPTPEIVEEIAEAIQRGKAKQKAKSKWKMG